MFMSSWNRGCTAITNLITDVPGIRVGHAEDARIASGTTVVLFDKPATASIAVHGGAPGLRDSALLEPEMTVDKIDALVLSGGSVFRPRCHGWRRGIPARAGPRLCGPRHRVPIVPGAIIFDLLNGGDKAWGNGAALLASGLWRRSFCEG